jgi:hypothetical protein
MFSDLDKDKQLVSMENARSMSYDVVNTGSLIDGNVRKTDGENESKKDKPKKKSAKTKVDMRRAKSVTGQPGDPDGSSDSSDSSSFSSSAYSSTISSHLSGDEDKEKHHITDVYRDENEVERMNLN